MLLGGLTGFLFFFPNNSTSKCFLSLVISFQIMQGDKIRKEKNIALFPVPDVCIFPVNVYSISLAV